MNPSERFLFAQITDPVARNIAADDLVDFIKAIHTRILALETTTTSETDILKGMSEYVSDMAIFRENVSLDVFNAACDYYEGFGRYVKMLENIEGIEGWHTTSKDKPSNTISDVDVSNSSSDQSTPFDLLSGDVFDF